MALPGRDARSGTGAQRKKTTGGRPSRDAAEQLRERILAAATDLMLVNGYGATSIEEVARVAGVSKRTFYHRFEDKAALMGAVVTRLIDSLRPPSPMTSFDGEDLQGSLLRLASMILEAALAPQAIRMHRLIVAESGRFPDLAAAVAKAGGRREAEKLIGDLLLRDRRREGADNAEVAFAAQQFLHMVMSVPQLRALGLGVPMTGEELAAWARRSVALFLDGWRVRTEEGEAGRRPEAS